MPKPLSQAVRRVIFYAWVTGNQKLAAGERPETMAEIGARYGVSPQGVSGIIRDFSPPDANRRKPGAQEKRLTCDCPLDEPCKACEKRNRRRERMARRYADPQFREEYLARQNRRRALKKGSA